MRKSCCILNRQIGQNLAVELHAGLLQSADELVVVQSIQAGGGADAHDPDRAVLALFLLAARVGKLQRAVDGFFRRAVEFGFSKEVSTGAFKNLFALGAAFGSAFYTRHGCSPFLSHHYWRLEVRRLLPKGISEAQPLHTPLRDRSLRRLG